MRNKKQSVDFSEKLAFFEFGSSIGWSIEEKESLISKRSNKG